MAYEFAHERKRVTQLGRNSQVREDSGLLKKQ